MLKVYNISRIFHVYYLATTKYCRKLHFDFVKYLENDFVNYLENDLVNYLENDLVNYLVKYCEN